MAFTLVILLTFFAMTVQAQGGGFEEPFDDPALPGWERSPGVAAIGGILKIELGNVLTRLGMWADMELRTRLRTSGVGEGVFFNQFREAGRYQLTIGPEYVLLQRLA